MVGILLVELRHHAGQVVLIAVHLIVSGKVERQPLLRHEVFESAADDVAQALLSGGEFQTNDLEFPGDGFRRPRNVLVLDDLTVSACSARPEMSDSKWLLPVP